MNQITKQILSLILLISLFYLFIFYLPSKKDDNVVEIVENIQLETQIKNDYFNRNLECLKLKDNIKEKQEKISDNLAGEITVGQIFYSPKVNSCVYLTRLELESDFYTRELYDVMNDEYESKPLIECNSSYPSSSLREFYEGYMGKENGSNFYFKEIKACDDFDQKVEEYKI